jgi:ATP-dependent Clp protease ATP-binding subunit ClpA
MRWSRRRSNPEFRPVEAYLFAGVDEARALGHDTVGTEHVLLGMLHNEGGDASRLLRRLDVEPRTVEETLGLERADGGSIDAAALASLGIEFGDVRHRLEASFGKGAFEQTRAGCLGVDPHLKMALAAATERAGDRPGRDEDVLLGILGVPESHAAEVLVSLGATREAIGAAIAGNHRAEDL